MKLIALVTAALLALSLPAKADDMPGGTRLYTQCMAMRISGGTDRSSLSCLSYIDGYVEAGIQAHQKDYCLKENTSNLDIAVAYTDFGRANLEMLVHPTVTVLLGVLKGRFPCKH